MRLSPYRKAHLNTRFLLLSGFGSPVFVGRNLLLGAFVHQRVTSLPSSTNGAQASARLNRLFRSCKHANQAPMKIKMNSSSSKSQKMNQLTNQITSLDASARAIEPQCSGTTNMPHLSQRNDSTKMCDVHHDKGIKKNFDDTDLLPRKKNLKFL